MSDREFHDQHGRTSLSAISVPVLAPWMAGLACDGRDLRTVYLGSLMGTTIPYFQSPVPGLPLVHWNERY